MNQDHAKCPSCGERGKEVEIATVKTLIREPNLIAYQEDDLAAVCCSAVK